MRKLVLLALMAIVSLQLFAQTTADTWYFIEEDWMEERFAGGKYYLGADTTLNGIIYRSLWREGGFCGNAFIGGLRQSADGMQVYWCRKKQYSENPDNFEYMLYDFSAKIGDTIRNAYFNLWDMSIYTDHVGEPEWPFWVVTDKKTIDGRIHLTVARFSDEEAYRNIPNYSTTWIQGIGTAFVLWPYYYSYCGTTTLRAACVMQGDEILYQYDLSYLGITTDCSEWHWKYDALPDIQANDEWLNTSDNPYNILGQPVDNTYHGIVIRNGKKVLQ